MDLLQKFKECNMKRYFVSVLLSLSALISVPLSSLSASALSSYDYYQGRINIENGELTNHTLTGVYTYDDYMIYTSAHSGTVSTSINLMFNDGIYVTGTYNRMALMVWSVTGVSTSDFTYYPSTARLHYTQETTTYSGPYGDIGHYDNYYVSSNGNRQLGFIVTFDISDWVGTNFSRIRLTGSGTFPQCNFSVIIYNESDGVDLAALINAINNQTSVLSGAISDQTSELESGDGSQVTTDLIDETVEDIQDKMGVLSFGETVLDDFVDLWTVQGSTALTLPGFKMTINNVEYTVWQDQQFNLTSLDGWFGAFMSVVRMVLPIIVWLAVLKYIINQFEVFWKND